MRPWFFLGLLTLVTALAGGCATSNEGDVSSIPWNRPQSWEGAGALGGFRPPGSAGY
jgi:hypothetical protein